MKYCPSCTKTKPLPEFIGINDRVTKMCKPCREKRARYERKKKHNRSGKQIDPRVEETGEVPLRAIEKAIEGINRHYGCINTFNIGSRF